MSICFRIALAALALIPAAHAGASSLSFDVSKAYGLIPNSAFVDAPTASLGGPTAFATDNTTARYFEFGDPPEFVLPRFDPALGTLTGVELTYTVGDYSELADNEQGFANRVVVGLGALDTDCGTTSCNKELEIRTVFTYGLDIKGVVDGANLTVGGANFDVAVQSPLQTGRFDTLISTGGISSFGSVLGMPEGLTSTQTFSGGQLSQFVGTGNLTFIVNAAAQTRLDLDCTAAAGTFLGECEQLVAVNFAPVFDTRLTYIYDEPIGAGDGLGSDPGDTGNGGTPGDITNPGGDGVTPPVAPIPLPAGLPLLLAGLAAFGVVRLRARR